MLHLCNFRQAGMFHSNSYQKDIETDTIIQNKQNEFLSRKYLKTPSLIDIAPAEL